VQRDVLRELAVLARAPEADSYNVGTFVAEHAVELAPLLGTTETDLEAAAAHADVVVVHRLGSRIGRAVEGQRQQRLDEGARRAERAALIVGRTARWFELGAVLDIELVLGDLLADSKRKHVAFSLPAADTVVVEARLLRRARVLRRIFIDATCFVARDGFHFRWRGGRGALRFSPLHVSATDRQNALLVTIPPRMRERQPELLGLVLEHLGLLT